MKLRESIPVLVGALLSLSCISAHADEASLAKGGYKSIEIAELNSSGETRSFGLTGDGAPLGTMSARGDHLGGFVLTDTAGGTAARGVLEFEDLPNTKHMNFIPYGDGVGFSMTVMGPDAKGAYGAIGVIKNRIWKGKLPGAPLEHQLTIYNAAGELIADSNVKSIYENYSFRGDATGSVVAVAPGVRQLRSATGDQRLMTLAAAFRGSTVNLFNIYSRRHFLDEPKSSRKTGETPGKKINAAATSEKLDQFKVGQPSYVLEPASSPEAVETIAGMG